MVKCEKKRSVFSSRLYAESHHGGASEELCRKKPAQPDLSVCGPKN